MAQVAFSHQFSHRWSNAPQSVKDALIQEFEDIVQLLEPETDLESFQFSVPDLHAHIEAINAEVAAEQEAARIEAEKLEAERLEAKTAEREAQQAEQLQQTEQQESERQQIEAMEAERLQLEHEATEQQRVFDAEEAAHLARMQQQSEATPNSDDVDQLQQAEVIGTETEADIDADETATEEASESQQSEAEQQNLDTDPTGSEPEASEQQAIPEPSETTSSFAFDNSHPGTEFDADFVKELESRIDDYLSEQLANMSEDLKSWLRDQVANRLNSK